MIKVEYNPNEGNLDPFMKELIVKKKEKIKSQNDDTLLFVFGETGSGKSELSLNIQSEYLGDDRMNVDLVGLCRPTIAKAVKSSKDMPLPRSALLDEANVNKRDSLSKFNKDMMDLFMAVRGLNIFWIWCNPSANMMDKFFIEERISGFIFVKKNTIGKGTDKRRVYYFFKTEKLIQILEKYGNLKPKTINKVRKKYAMFRGWFKPYTGKIKQEYLEKKESRMEHKTEDFCDKYGEKEKTYTFRDMARKFNKDPSTIKRWFTTLLEDGKIKEDEDFVTNGGSAKFFENIVPKFFKHSAEMHNKQKETGKKNQPQNHKKNKNQPQKHKKNKNESET